MSMYSNQLQPALQNLLHVVRFFDPRSSCTTHISADFQRITLNASCMMISGGRTEQLDIIAGFLLRHWLYEWFSQFQGCGTYSVLSRSPSIASSGSLAKDISFHICFKAELLITYIIRRWMSQGIPLWLNDIICWLERVKSTLSG